MAMFAAAIATSPPPPPMSTPNILHYHYYYPCHDRRRASSLLVTSSSSYSSLSKSNLTKGRGRISHGHFPINLISSSTTSANPISLYSSFSPSTSPCTATGSSLVCTEEAYDIDKCGLVLIGVNMATAPAVVPERLTFSGEEEFSYVIQRLPGLPFIKEFFVRTTHDQFELYAVVQPLSSLAAAQESIINWMSKESDVPSSELSRHVFVHRDGKAATHLFEASVSDAIDRPRGVQFRGSSLHTAQTLGEKYCVCGVVLCDLLAKAYFLQAMINVSAEKAIGSAALAVARAELRGTKSSPNTLVVGGNMSLCESIAAELVFGLRIVGKFSENEVAVHVCCDHDEVDLDDNILKDQLESIGVTCRPISQLLYAASEANLIFITSPSSNQMFSKADIDGLLPIAHDEDGECSSSRIFIDMCYPPNITSKGSISSARVFNIEDLFKVIHRQASDFRIKMNGEVQDLESWIENAAFGRDGTAYPQPSLSQHLMTIAYVRNHGRICDRNREDIASRLF